MFNPIFAPALALFAAPFKFDADNDSAIAVSPLGTANLACFDMPDDEKKFWDADSNYAVALHFEGNTDRYRADLRSTHVVATFKTKNEARAFLRDLVSIQNARFNI